MVTGGLIGAISGYFGGRIDTVIMRLMDMLMAIPGTPAGHLRQLHAGQRHLADRRGRSRGRHRPQLPHDARHRPEHPGRGVHRGRQGLRLRNLRVILTHVIPNCLAPIIVDCTLRLSGNIMMISGLSFIGLGVQPPTPEWGSMLNAGREFIRKFYPLITFPGIAIMLTMFGFNMFGDGLRDAMDPKLKD